MSSESAIHYGERPGLLKLINGLGGIGAKIFSPPPFTVDSLVAAANKKSSLNGAVHPEFADGLQALVESLGKSKQLDFSGHILARQTIISALSNQFHIQDEVSRRPDIDNEKIERPIFVVGFPRTGTTFIHNLLALDENGRAPKMWEVIKPDVVSRINETERQRRISEAEKFVKFAYYLVPQLKAIHELYPDGADECLKLIENSFTSPHFCLYFDIPDYWDWLLNAGPELFVSVYQYHKKQLQLLQYGTPEKHWVLKTPVHLFFLDALLKVYPDACIVHMERDPLECIPSFCSLVGVNRALFSNKIDTHEIGRFGLEFYKENSKRAASAIKSARRESVINIQYKDFIANPKAAVSKIYEYFDMPYTESHLQRIDQWIANHPKNKHGAHRYTLEQFGLTLDDIRSSLDN